MTWSIHAMSTHHSDLSFIVIYSISIYIHFEFELTLNWLERHTSDFSYTLSFEQFHIKLHYLAFPPFTYLPEHALKWIILHRSVYCCSEKFCALTRPKCCTISICLRVFSLVHIRSLRHKKRHKERIRTMYLSNSTYVPRIFLGLMALSFITELLMF